MREKNFLLLVVAVLVESFRNMLEKSMIVLLWMMDMRRGWIFAISLW